MGVPEHVPVMSAEVVTALAPERGGVFVDCTLGLGGHAAAVLAAGATRVIGIDRDEEALAIARERLARWPGQVDFVHADFRGIDEVLDARGCAARRRYRGRPRGFLAAVRWGGARVQFPEGRAARHADGPIGRSDGRRCDRGPVGGGTGGRDLPLRRGAVSRGALPGSWSRPGAPVRSPRRANSPRSCGGRFRGRGTARFTPRRARFRRCGLR